MEAVRILFSLLMMGLGVLGVLFPRATWYLADGWKFQDAEPSDLALLLNRVGGVVVFVLGLWVLLVR